MVFQTSEDAEKIATVLVQMAKEKMETNGRPAQTVLGVCLTEIYCRAMLQTFPDLGASGDDILQIVQNAGAIASFPDPRRDAMRVAAREIENAQSS